MEFGGRAVLRLDDVCGVVRRAEVAGVVGGGDAAGLPLVLAQVLLEVAGVGVGRTAELAGVDGGRGICNAMENYYCYWHLAGREAALAYCSTWRPYC